MKYVMCHFFYPALFKYFFKLWYVFVQFCENNYRRHLTGGVLQFCYRRVIFVETLELGFRRGGEYYILILSIESWLSPWSGPRRGKGGAEGGYLAYDYISYRYSRYIVDIVAVVVTPAAQYCCINNG